MYFCQDSRFFCPVCQAVNAVSRLALSVPFWYALDMVRLSKLTDYAVVLLTQMVRGSDARDGKVATTALLSEMTGLPHPTVSKVLKRLTKTGLLVAQRGATGGYSLTRPAEHISVADIVIAFDGPIALTDCTKESHQSCQMEKRCLINGHWNRVNIAIRDALQNVSLADMAHDLQSFMKPPVIKNTAITKHQRDAHDSP
jgi:FeS assembly SUF system regulator